MNSSNQHDFLFADNLRDRFLEEEWSASPSKSFEDINVPEDVWEWLNVTVLDALYPETFFNDDPLPESEEEAVTIYNRLIGTVQLRQIRMKNGSCVPEAPVNDVLCFSPNFEEDKEDFGPNGMYRYQEDGLARFYSKFGGFFERFPPSGFAEYLGSNRSSASEKLEELKANRWLDEKTRVMTVTVNVYNPNVDRFGVLFAVLEYLPSRGTFMPYADVKTFPYNHTSGWLIAGQVFVLFYVFFVEFLPKEINEIYTIWTDMDKSIWRNYVREIWNWLEWSIILLFIAILALHVTIVVQLNDLTFPDPFASYLNLDSLSTLIDVRNSFISVFVLLCYLRALKLFQVPPKIGPTILSITQTLTSWTLLVFTALTVALIFVFALAFYLTFGTDISSFRNIGNSFMSILQSALGDTDYKSLEQSNRWLGPIFFLIFVYFIQILLMQSVFIAVITNLYSDILERNSLDWDRRVTNLLIEKYIDQKGSLDKRRIRYFCWIQILTDYINKHFFKKIWGKMKEWKLIKWLITKRKSRPAVRWKEEDISNFLNKQSKEDKSPVEDKLEELKRETQSQLTELEKGVTEVLTLLKKQQ